MRNRGEVSSGNASRSGGDDQEVHCGDAVPVIVEERPPPSTLIVVRISLREISRDGGELLTKGELNNQLLVSAPK
jgi:hypothetical protein